MTIAFMQYISEEACFQNFFNHHNLEKKGHVCFADEGKVAEIIGSGAVKCVVGLDTVAENKRRALCFDVWVQFVVGQEISEGRP